jgi:hypothetical protein
MKKTLVYFAAFSIFACLIVLPVIASVNSPVGSYATSTPTLISEGDPMPSPVPPMSRAGVLVAEGDPMPSPVPPLSNTGTLVAEGDPMPSPVPPTSYTQAV